MTQPAGQSAAFTRIAPLSDLPQGRGVRVEVGDHRIALFRIQDDVYAVGDRCSHAEASLAEGEVFGTEVECPRHGSEFDLTTGEPGALPATKPIPVYDVSIIDGIVFLDLADASSRDNSTAHSPSHAEAHSTGSEGPK